ncbi:hypothetical protein HF078_06885 [Bacillus sp. RO2]|uniref:hypothetical protein n=1 Tax=Bacillus sp. RO2 TaxID=2723913 RepID=UPI00145D7EF4|nr:hypothetical protein [Bacillus sp. RO2]NMH72791.1 hypothetical protein [Bacillus sp. RO2]
MNLKRSFITAYLPVEVRFDVFQTNESIDVFLWSKGLRGAHIKGTDEEETIQLAIKQFEEENGVKVELPKNK